MALTINHQTDDISNLTGVTTFNGVAVGGDNTPVVWYGSRGVFAGINTTSNNASNIIEYITIASPGNAIDFGDLAPIGGSGTGVKRSNTGTSNGHGGL